MSQPSMTDTQPLPSLFYNATGQGAETPYSGSKGAANRNAPFAYGNSNATTEEENRRRMTEHSDARSEQYTTFPNQQRLAKTQRVHGLDQQTDPLSVSRQKHAIENNYLERELAVQHKPQPHHQGQRSIVPAQRASDPTHDTVSSRQKKRAVHGHQETNRRMVPNVATKANDFETPFMEQSFAANGPIDSFAAGGGTDHVGGGAPGRIVYPMHQQRAPLETTPAPWLQK